MRVIHLADTHIRSQQYHKEFRQVFKKMEEIIDSKKPDVIVHCGDLYHSKTQLSPEYIDLCAEFISMLSKNPSIPLVMILGNHDLAPNKSRQDAVSPIISLLNKENVHLLRKSGEYHFGQMVGDKKVIFNAFSMVDKDGWISPTEKKNINICLYHGSISGCLTDTNYRMEFGENDISIFDGFDFAMLGDIHKSNQKLDLDGRFRYPGSTLQQNHGEPDDKGFLVWDIEGKDDFKVKHISIGNPKPFTTIFLNADGTFDKEKIPSKARLRVITEHSLGTENVKKVLDQISFNHKPESLSFINKSNDKTFQAIREKNCDVVNLSDLAIQERLIKDYLQDFNLTDDLLRDVCLLNKVYHEQLNKQNYYDNIHYDLLELSWDNFGKFKEGNSINFEHLDGVIGIFGRNFIGKSSIIEAILYCISGGVSKETKKTIDLINHEKDYCFAKIKIRIGNQVFTIERRSEKFIKRLHGKETEEAKTTVHFFVEDEVLKTIKDLDGETVPETNKEIQKYFGSLEDFLLTTVSAQEEAMVFIKKTSTVRKELLSKFLGVDSFKKKFDLANNDAKQTKTLMKKFKETNFDQLIEQTSSQLTETAFSINQTENLIDIWKDSIAKKQMEMKDFDAMFQKFVHLDRLIFDEEKEQKNIQSLKGKREIIFNERTKKEREKERLKELLEQFDIEKIKQDQEISGKLELELIKLNADLKETSNEMKHLTKNAQILKEVPCGDQFPTCKFIKNAHEAKNSVDLVSLNRENLLKELENKKNDVRKLNIDEIKEKIEQFESIQKDFVSCSVIFDKILSDLDKNKQDQFDRMKELKQIQQEISKMKEEGVEKDKKDQIFDQKQEVDEKIKEMEQNIEEMTKTLFELHSKNGSLKEKLANLHSQKKEHDKLSRSAEVFDLYLQCAHPNGISYSLIKKSLPILNEKLQEILSSKVDFDIFFDGTDDDKLEVFLQRENKRATPIECCSGAERVVASAAIRLAFLSISSIPRGNLFVLDEPATSLDTEQMQAFIQMLDIVKGYFKNVILISHLDVLKDTADVFLDIQMDENGFSSLNV